MPRSGDAIALPRESIDGLRLAVESRDPIAGLTHTFYRYPACFSPIFARAVITAFTKPGDIVLDPFVGGGTTLVEALAAGRQAIGADISQFAVFVSRAKTTRLLSSDASAVRTWADGLDEAINLRNPVVRPEGVARTYQRNVEGQDTWPIRKTVELALEQLPHLPLGRQRRFARCAILRTAKWALDCRETIPTAGEFREQFHIFLDEMLLGAREFRLAVSRARGLSGVSDRLRAVCLNTPAAELADQLLKLGGPSPKLVLTSPPYPGVHVLYHRWQVRGRKETPAPFWISNSLDGHGASFYTLGDYRSYELEPYFEQIRGVFSSLRARLSPKTVVAQMLAFSEPEWQLPRYLQEMTAAGFAELKIKALSSAGDDRLWRVVPNRRFHAAQKGSIAPSNEVVLFHRPIT